MKRTARRRNTSGAMRICWIFYGIRTSPRPPRQAARGFTPCAPRSRVSSFPERSRLAAYVFDGSLVYLPQDHWQQHDGNNYLINVTFANGARAVESPLRCGYYNASDVIEYVSAGATVSTNAAGINLCYHN